MLPLSSPRTLEAALLQQIEELRLEKAVLIRRGCQEAENAKEELNEALEENRVLKNLNNELSKENKDLKEDNIAQGKRAAQAEMYSKMLETMLDQARDDAEFRPSLEETEELDKMKETANRLQKEKDELNVMMEEFKAMWSKDSKNFQETLKTVREEGETLKQEVAKLEGLRLDLEESQNEAQSLRDQKEVEVKTRIEIETTNEQLLTDNHNLRSDLQFAYSDLQILREEKDAVSEAHEKTIDTNELLLNEVRKHRSDLQAAQNDLHNLREQKTNVDIKLTEQESWMQKQAIDLSSALNELFESRERTSRQIQDMQECSRLKQDAYEQELAEIKKQKEEAKNFYETEKTDLSVQLDRAVRELEALRYEYSYTVPSLQEQLTMLRSESNSNYDRYIKYQTRTTGLEKTLEQYQKERERESEMFAATMDGVETQLNECKAALAQKTMDHEQAVIKLQNSEEKVFNLQSEVSSMNDNLATIHDKLVQTQTEEAKLREKLAATLRETVIERERMEQKHEDSIAAVKKRFSQQIEEAKHNNMLAINQEMIKAQMALDSEKKKNALEYCDIMKKWEQAVSAHEVAKKESANSIASLCQEVITLRNHNKSIQRECAKLKDSQIGDQTAIAKLKSDMRCLEQATAEAIELHESKVNRLMEENQKRLENMGVEELDDDDECQVLEVKQRNEPAEWEMVDEE